MEVLTSVDARVPHLIPASSQGCIAHVVPEYLPRSATFIHTLLSHQTRFRPLVLTQCLSHLDEFPVERVLPLGGRSSVLLRAMRRLRAVASRYGTDYERRIAEEASRAGCLLLHAHFGWSGRDSAAAARRLDIPLVTTFYGRDLSEATRARRRDPYRRLFAGGVLFLVEGPAMAAHLARIGCPADRIRIVPIGIDVSRFPFAYRPRSSSFVVVHTGRFVEKKGTDLAIRAFAAARQELGQSELWLVGDGPLRKALEVLVDELDMRDAVRFLGMLSHAEYRELVARAEVCLQPSRTARDGDTEGGAPTVILEMQALGVPVVATRHADIPFVVPRPDELSDEGDVDALARALVEAGDEPDAERRARAEEARDFVVTRHDASVTAAAVEALYDEALA